MEADAMMSPRRLTDGNNNALLSPTGGPKPKTKAPKVSNTLQSVLSPIQLRNPVFTNALRCDFGSDNAKTLYRRKRKSTPKKVCSRTPSWSEDEAPKTAKCSTHDYTGTETVSDCQPPVDDSTPSHPKVGNYSGTEKSADPDSNEGCWIPCRDSNGEIIFLQWMNTDQLQELNRSIPKGGAEITKLVRNIIQSPVKSKPQTPTVTSSPSTPSFRQAFCSSASSSHQNCAKLPGISSFVSPQSLLSPGSHASEQRFAGDGGKPARKAAPFSPDNITNVNPWSSSPRSVMTIPRHMPSYRPQVRPMSWQHDAPQLQAQSYPQNWYNPEAYGHHPPGGVRPYSAPGHPQWSPQIVPRDAFPPYPQYQQYPQQYPQYPQFPARNQAPQMTQIRPVRSTMPDNQSNQKARAAVHNEELTTTTWSNNHLNQLTNPTFTQIPGYHATNLIPQARVWAPAMPRFVNPMEGYNPQVAGWSSCRFAPPRLRHPRPQGASERLPLPAIAPKTVFKDTGVKVIFTPRPSYPATIRPVVVLLNEKLLDTSGSPATTASAPTIAVQRLPEPSARANCDLVDGTSDSLRTSVMSTQKSSNRYPVQEVTVPVNSSSAQAEVTENRVRPITNKDVCHGFTHLDAHVKALKEIAPNMKLNVKIVPEVRVSPIMRIDPSPSESNDTQFSGIPAMIVDPCPSTKEPDRLLNTSQHSNIQVINRPSIRRFDDSETVPNVTSSIEPSASRVEDVTRCTAAAPNLTSLLVASEVDATASNRPVDSAPDDLPMPLRTSSALPLPSEECTSATTIQAETDVSVPVADKKTRKRKKRKVGMDSFVLGRQIDDIVETIMKEWDEDIGKDTNNNVDEEDAMFVSLLDRKNMKMRKQPTDEGSEVSNKISDQKTAPNGCPSKRARKSLKTPVKSVKGRKTGPPTSAILLSPPTISDDESSNHSAVERTEIPPLPDVDDLFNKAEQISSLVADIKAASAESSASSHPPPVTVSSSTKKFFNTAIIDILKANRDALMSKAVFSDVLLSSGALGDITPMMSFELPSDDESSRLVIDEENYEDIVASQQDLMDTEGAFGDLEMHVIQQMPEESAHKEANIVTTAVSVPEATEDGAEKDDDIKFICETKAKPLIDPNRCVKIVLKRLPEHLLNTWKVADVIKTEKNRTDTPDLAKDQQDEENADLNRTLENIEPSDYAELLQMDSRSTQQTPQSDRSAEPAVVQAETVMEEIEVDNRASTKILEQDSNSSIDQDGLASAIDAHFRNHEVSEDSMDELDSVLIIHEPLDPEEEENPAEEEVGEVNNNSAVVIDDQSDGEVNKDDSVFITDEQSNVSVDMEDNETENTVEELDKSENDVKELEHNNNSSKDLASSPLKVLQVRLHPLQFVEKPFPQLYSRSPTLPPKEEAIAVRKFENRRFPMVDVSSENSDVVLESTPSRVMPTRRAKSRAQFLRSQVWEDWDF